jgi:hypothetical protein
MKQKSIYGILFLFLYIFSSNEEVKTGSWSNNSSDYQVVYYRKTE